MSERRSPSVRRDLNDLVRDDKGKVSNTKIGTLLGQGMAIKLLWDNGTAIIANWDSLTVLFAMLIAPELFKRLMNLKYGGTTASSETTSTQTTTSQQKTT